MSNHSGSHMLNELLTEMIDVGTTISLSKEQKGLFANKPRKTSWNYDCNWSEIIDARLAHEFGVCRCCGNSATELDEEGYIKRH